MKRRCHSDEPLRVAFRGTALDARQLALIRGIVESGPGRTRQDLSREVCRVFRWRRPNGTWPVRSARDLLVRLEKAGVLRLPAPRRAQGRPCREAVETAAAALWAASAPTAAEPSAQQGAGSLLVVRPIRADEVLGWRAHMERFHYLGDVALVGESLRYGAHLDGELVALLSWGAASLRNQPRDRYVGWDDATKEAKLGLVVNNTRFLVLPWARRPHLASRVLGANLRRLSRDWEEVYGHPVVLAESFVDTARFRGTCYRASNWVCVGETKGWSRSGSGYRFNGQPKSVWLYPLRRDFKQQLCAAADTGSRKEGFMVLDVEDLDRRTGNWIAEQRRLQPGSGLAMDGKTVRGSGDGDKPTIHLLSAIVHGSGTVVSQVAVESKTNEITKVEPLLENLDIEGVVVTGDALLTQREIARHIVEDKHADYVFTAKDNQPTLKKDISDLFAAQEEEAKRRQQAARKKPPEREAFPPSAPDRR